MADTYMRGTDVYIVPDDVFNARFWARIRVNEATGCWLWTGPTIGDSEYGVVTRHRKKYPAYRYADILTNGPIGPDLDVCHRCDVLYAPDDRTYRRCINPDHLFRGTRRENMADMVAKGRSAWQNGTFPDRSGEHHSRAKLTNAEYLAIEAAARAGESRYALAKRYGVSYSLIAKIIRHELRAYLWG